MDIHNKFTILERFHVRCPSGKMEWRVKARCVCGVVKEIRLANLENGRTKSCGCLRIKEAGQRNFKHGQTKTPLFSLWQAMIERCKYKKEYVDRNIQVCEEWLEFLPFKEYIDEHLGTVPKGFSLDRIDNDKNYQPGNIRYASPKTQARNRSSNRLLTVDGITKCLAAWAEELNISQQTLYVRLKRGWTIEEAIKTPLKNK